MKPARCSLSRSSRGGLQFLSRSYSCAINDPSKLSQRNLRQNFILFYLPKGAGPSVFGGGGQWFISC
jgi:hypothetical protein